MIRFIHAADIHLDSPLHGLEQYEGAPADRIRTAPRAALVNLVDLALRLHVHFVVIAGDIYDGDWPDYGTGLFFSKQMARLNDEDIPVFLISGNHDASSKITRSLNLPKNVTRFDHQRPHSVVLESLAVAIHGQSFATQAVTEDLSIHYPAARPGYFNVGLLHTSGTGRDGHENYAPCTVDGLRNHGYDYWALGHIHQREVLCEKPFIAFSGNIQGRHIREVGAKGCFVVTVDAERHCDVHFESLDVLRWEHIVIDTPCQDTTSELLDEIAARIEKRVADAEGRWIACRITVRGPTSLHEPLNANRIEFTQEIRNLANMAGHDSVWIEKIRFETSPLEAAEAQSDISEDAISEILEVFDGFEQGSIPWDNLGLDMSDLHKKLPADLRQDLLSLRAGLPPDWIAEARTRLVQLLRSNQEAP
jgi:DNA repair exonuclease SbcCD nuclease subunit